MRDPLGNDTRIDYDVFAMLPIRASDAVGLTVEAEYDYGIMQPRQVTDPNGNRSEFRFTPLGLLREVFVRGKAGADEGDRERASTRYDYDFLAFADSPPENRMPIFVRSVRREHHDSEPEEEQAERDVTIEMVEYSDGFGRLIQARTQAEDVLFGDGDRNAPLFGSDVLPADQSNTASTAAAVVGRQRDPTASGGLPNVAVSGWQIYDNKGQVVEKFEPFFSRGFDYLPPEKEQGLFGRNVLGQKVTVFYDPRGQVIRTVNPNGSEQRVVYGAPRALGTPDDFVPTPWEAYTYDTNDNAGRTHLADAASYQHHWNTPSHIVMDALGRTLLSVERNRAGVTSAIEQLATRSTYDIRSNLLTLTDALNRDAFRCIYDLANNPLRTEHIDSGVRRAIVDACGNEVERRDSKGALILQAYDALNRPIRLWARDDGESDSPMTLRERLVYGDSVAADLPNPTSLNLLGRLHKHYDEAGLLTYGAYDFKGNLLEKARRTIRDEEILTVFAARRPDETIPIYRVDWQPAADADLGELEGTLLDPNEHRTSITYDALNRVKVLRYPKDVEGQRRVLRPTYNRAGALERVDLDGATYIQHIAYNAKGQRSLIALGNGVMTRYAYDPHTFRLLRLRSEWGLTALLPASFVVIVGAALLISHVRKSHNEASFILTGPDLIREGRRPKNWRLNRDPFLLETSVPGIFAVGDIRQGAVRRVASAVGQGSTAISFVHQYLKTV